MTAGAVIITYGVSEDGTPLSPFEKLGACSVVQRLVRTIQRAGIQRVILLTKRDGRESMEKHMAHWGVVCTEAENSGQTVGLLQTGIQALEGRCDRVLIAGIDVPFLAEKTVRTLMDSDAPLCRPTVAGQPGAVLCIAGSCFSALLSVPETTVLEQLAGCLHMPVSEVPVEDEGALAGRRERYPALMERRRHEPIHVTFKLRLCRERPFFGPGTVQLLTQIDETESVRLACRQMGISYSKGWKMIALMEEELGEQVVSRRQGGKNGGAASLTGVGRDLVDKYQRLERRCQELIEQAREEIFPSN